MATREQQARDVGCAFLFCDWRNLPTFQLTPCSNASVTPSHRVATNNINVHLVVVKETHLRVLVAIAFVLVVASR